MQKHKRDERVAALVRAYQQFSEECQRRTDALDPTWGARARHALWMMDTLERLTVEQAEIRRAFGSMIDAATLNRLDQNLAQTRQRALDLLRLAIDALAAEVQAAGS